MKAFVASVVVAAVMAVGAFYILKSSDQSASQAYTTTGARPTK